MVNETNYFNTFPAYSPPYAYAFIRSCWFTSKPPTPQFSMLTAKKRVLWQSLSWVLFLVISIVELSAYSGWVSVLLSKECHEVPTFRPGGWCSDPTQTNAGTRRTNLAGCSRGFLPNWKPLCFLTERFTCKLAPWFAILSFTRQFTASIISTPCSQTLW